MCSSPDALAEVDDAITSGAANTTASAETQRIRYVTARLRDFFDSSTPWQRRLWDAGAVLGLRELHDAITWSDTKVLSHSAAKWLAGDLERLLGRDRGVGDKTLHSQLQRLLRAPLANSNAHHRALAEITALIDSQYLARWAAAASEHDRLPSPERFARAVGTHLLDAGFSSQFLRDWVNRLSPSTLSEIAEAACELTSSPAHEYELLIPIARVQDLDGNLKTSQDWLPARETVSWFRAHGVSSEQRHNGGFRYVISARDAYAAADLGRETIDRMRARATYSRKNARLEPNGELWVGGLNRPVPLTRPSRGAFVLSLVSEKLLYAVGHRSALDNALEVASSLNEGPPAAAISGSWSAVESLLLAPADEAEGGRGALAADRMASLITCSWPRADLTALSYRHKPPSSDRLTVELNGADTNRDRAETVLKWMKGGNALNLESASDVAAAARMSQLVSAPRRTLGDIQKHMVTAMRRVYRHRNLVVHGGAVNVDTLPMTLRTAAPLIGAGLDRVTHAALVDGTHPVDLAVRADLRLSLLDTSAGRSLVDLLE
ncbi:hypothetical protein ALI44B_00720 [Leifsonia sp. ALI-44-B]|nr:hypothetical protein ALI44B_00720 [Leifsonia sp. ALI-44-B]